MSSNVQILEITNAGQLGDSKGRKAIDIIRIHNQSKA